MSRLAAVDRVLIYQSGSLIVEDSFTDDDSKALVNHTPDIANNNAAWFQDGTEDLVITDNKANSSDVATGDCFSGIDVNQQDLTVEATVQIPTETNPRTVDIICRYIDKDNYIGVRLEHFALLSIVSASIFSVVGGAPNSLTNLPDVTSANKGLPITFKIAANATSIVVSVNGGGNVTRADSIFSNSTKAGIRPDGIGVEIDNFNVSPT